MKPRNPGYKPGSYWAISDRSGIAYRIEEMRLEWNGLLVHYTEWEPRHAQDFIRGIKDDPSVKGPTRIDTPARFVSGTPCANTTARAGIAIAGCAVAGRSVNTDTSIPAGTFGNYL